MALGGLIRELRKLFAQKLKESGLSEAVARYAGLAPLTSEQTAGLWRGAPRQAALRIPYTEPNGKQTAFFRVRLLGELNGFNHQLAKPMRYLQAPASGVHIYFPHVNKLAWMDVLRDATNPLLITEGELKALAATQAGYPTLGLGGVSSWRSKAARTPALLADLEAIPWQGRDVFICYDSDASAKPQVMTEAAELAAALGERGARVFDATLPPNGKATKTGLDDFLVASGPKALEKHLQDAAEFASVRELHDFNRRFIFVRELAQVYEEQSHYFYDSGKFMNSVEANAIYTVVKPTAAGGLRSERRSVAKDWVAWPHRRSVQKVTYRPGCDELLPQEKDTDARVLNLWPGWGLAPKRGDLSLWHKLFRYLTAGESDATRRWFEQWLAYPLQHPGTKLYTAVAMWGAQTGTGKTLLGETMIRIYGANGQRIGAKQLNSPYNSWAQRKQFILGDEITGNNSRHHTDELKALLTGDWIRINEKYQPEYDLPNCVNCYFTSNHPDAFFVDDFDRRFVIFEAPLQRLEQTFYQAYHDWLHSDGPGALFEYLLRVNASDFDPRGAAPRTAAREMMVDTNRSDVGRFISLCVTDPEGAKMFYKVPTDVDLFTSKDLLTYYDPRGEHRVTERAISMELQRQGIVKVLRGAQVRVTRGGRMRLYALRNQEHWLVAGANVVREEAMKRIAVPQVKF